MGWAEEVTYLIESFSNDKGDFIVKAWGAQPEGSVATFWNDYGATVGNRFNQIPRNRQADLWLEGWEGCRLKSITLAMCSNNKAGTFGVTLTDGETELLRTRTEDFASEQWYGMWLSKDLGVYGNISLDLTETPTLQDAVTLTIKGGTQEGSVYLRSITIEYEPGSVATESPMGWAYEKMEAKGTLNEGDVVMLYRTGDAAGDIDGMEKSHYLDAIGMASTSDVREYDVERFTLSHDDTGQHWLLTDQWGRQLGAKGAQHLAWDEGVLTWDITLGYSGATIASTNTKYGTMRYNAPAGSYPRFWNYTSTSLALPYIYRRTKQLQPIQSTSLSLPWTERQTELGSQDTLLVKARLLPVTTTDTRIDWTSSNPDVATVRDGIVCPLTVGTTTITATSRDGGSQASMVLQVTEPKEDALDRIATETPATAKTSSKAPAHKVLRGKTVTIETPRGSYATDGRRL